MAVYKDKKRGTWYASVMYKDWTGKQCRKMKRGFATKKEAQEWETSFTVVKAPRLTMNFADFIETYEVDMRPKLKENTWQTKEHMIRTKILPYFEKKQMTDITSSDIIQWQNEMLKGTTDTGSEYAHLFPSVQDDMAQALDEEWKEGFLFSVLQPLAAVGDALNSFNSFFTGESTFTNSTLSDSEIEEIVAASGADETGEAVIRYALSKVGYPYSQENRSSGTAYDCSSLAYYAWKDAGVDISYGGGYPPSAAEGARMLEADGKSLSTMDLKPGDLVYYGGETNGRYLGIYHVAIYVGNGKAVEALSTRYGVVYQNLRTGNAIMVCRPN